MSQNIPGRHPFVRPQPARRSEDTEVAPDDEPAVTPSKTTAARPATLGQSNDVRESTVPASAPVPERHGVVESPTPSTCANDTAPSVDVSTRPDASEFTRAASLPGSPQSNSTASEPSPTDDKPVGHSGDNDTNRRAAAQTHVRAYSLRAGDTGLGRRPQPAVSKAPLTAEQAAEIQRRRDERDSSDAEPLAVAPTSASAEEKLRRLFVGPTALLMTLGVASLFGLFLCNQLLALVSQLALLPHWAQYLSWMALALMVVAVLAAGARLLWLYFRWRRVDQISSRTLRELGEREALRRNARSAAKQFEAIRQLREYLERYVLPWENDSSWANPIPPDEELSQKFSAARERLLRPTEFANVSAWLDEFIRDVQSPLDELAQKRIERHARRVAIKTAVSPYAIADVLIAIYYGLTLMGDLCCIYNVRTDRLGAARLLIRVFFNAYVAGRINELEPVAEDGVRPFLEEGLAKVVGPEEVTAKIGAGLVGKASVRVASGLVNYVLFRRLGRATIQLLRPVDPA